MRRDEVNDQHEQNLRDELQREKRDDARQLAVLGEQTADCDGEICVQIDDRDTQHDKQRKQQRCGQTEAVNRAARFAKESGESVDAGRQRHQKGAGGQKDEGQQRRRDGGNQLGRDVLAHRRGQDQLNIAFLAEHAEKAVDVRGEADHQHRDEAHACRERQQGVQPIPMAGMEAEPSGEHGGQRYQCAQRDHADAYGQHGGKRVPKFNFEQFANHARNTSLKYSSTLHPCSSRSSSTL